MQMSIRSRRTVEHSASSPDASEGYRAVHGDFPLTNRAIRRDEPEPV